MTSEYPEEFGGFKIPLYALFHIKEINKNSSFFGKKEAEIALRDYGEEKIKTIVKGLKWAINNREFDYKNIFPGMKYSNEEILFYFEKLLQEMIESGICNDKNVSGNSSTS